MSRIKYPGEQEMKRQIQVILDESCRSDNKKHYRRGCQGK